jgi:Tfp pilus assembly protein PilF
VIGLFHKLAVSRGVLGKTLLVCVLIALIGAGLMPLYLSLRYASHLRAARQELQRRDLAAARTHLRLCRDTRPGDPELHLLLARASRLGGFLADAEYHLNLCQELGASTEAINLERALLRAQQGRWSPALELQLQKYIDQDHPELLAVLDAASQGAAKEYRLDTARYCLNLWLEREPVNVRALQRRGWVWERLHQFKEAAADYRQAIATEPDNISAQLHLAQVLQQLGEAREAVEWFTKLHQQRPEDADILLGLARCRRTLGENEAAERLIDDLAARTPDDAAVLLERGRLALSQQKPQQAEGWLRRAAQLAPHEYQTNYSLFLCLNQLDRREEAEKYHRRVQQIEADLVRLHDLTDRLQSRPYDADMRCEVGRLFLRSGEEGQGILWLESALRIDPEHQPSHQTLAEHYEQNGQSDQAAPHRRFLPDSAGSASLGGKPAPTPASSGPSPGDAAEEMP